MGCGSINSQNVNSPIQSLYQRHQLISQTPQTIVYHCKDKLGQQFCYKKYKNIKINQENYQNYLRFKNQAHRLKKLSETTNDLVRYENVIVDEDKCLVLVMQLIKQKTLKQCLKISQKPILSQRNVSNYCEQVIKVLKYLRQNGSIFCNVKCNNIFISEDKKGVMLSDFHHMRQFFIEEVSDVIYMSPENSKSNSYFKQTDIWRIGCIVLEMITGKQPWSAYKHDQKQIKQKLALGMHLSFPINISHECHNFLQKCFQTLPSMRSNLNDLLNHPFIKQIVSKTKLKTQLKIEPISKNNISIQIIQNSPKKQKNRNKKLSALNNENTTQILRKSGVSINLSNQDKSLERSPSAHSYKKKRQSQVSLEIAKPVKIKKQFVTNKYIKYRTEQQQEQSPSRIDRKEGAKSKQQILELLQKKQKDLNLFQKQNNKESPGHQSPKYKLTKKMPRTSNYRITKSSSKSKIRQNQITLNNKKIISTTSKIHESYEPLEQYKDHNSIQMMTSTHRIDSLIKQLGQEGDQQNAGEKYYKNPLRLLKKRLKYLKTANTETSIKEDQNSSTLQSRVLQNYNSSNLFKNQSSIRLMTEQSHEQEAIDTAVSRAQKNRYLAEQQVLRQQRQSERLLWQNELKQQQGMLQDRFSYRYQKKTNIAAQQILSNFNKNSYLFTNSKRVPY